MLYIVWNCSSLYPCSILTNWNPQDNESLKIGKNEISAIIRKFHFIYLFFGPFQSYFTSCSQKLSNIFQLLKIWKFYLWLFIQLYCSKLLFFNDIPYFFSLCYGTIITWAFCWYHLGYQIMEASEHELCITRKYETVWKSQILLWNLLFHCVFLFRLMELWL